MRKAETAGVLLAAEDFIARRAVKDTSCRVVDVRLDDRQFAQLIDASRRYRQTPADLARDYVVGGLADNSRSMMDVKVAAEPDAELVQQLAEARAQVRELKADIDKHKRSVCVSAQVDLSKVIEARDAVIAAVEQNRAEEIALRKGAIERMKKAEAERDEARATHRELKEKLHYEQEARALRFSQLEETKVALAKAGETALALHAERDEARAVAEGFQRELEAQRQEVIDLETLLNDEKIANAQLFSELYALQNPGTPPAVAVINDDGLARSVRALKAAGNSPREISRQLGIEPEAVKSILGRAA